MEDSCPMNESCRKPDKVGKCRKDHPMFKDKCCLPDTDENRLKVKKTVHCCFDRTKEERLQWADPEQIDPDTGDIRGMDLHHKAKKRGFANPMEMYLADKKDEEDKKVKDEECRRKDREDKKDKETEELKKKLEKSQQDFDDYKKTMEARFDKLATMLQALGGSK